MTIHDPDLQSGVAVASGDAVKIWNQIQVAMSGKRIIYAPCGLLLPVDER
jgi:hypothetical protein